MSDISTEDITTSHRDPEEIGRSLRTWLAEQMPGTEPAVSDVSKPSGNGMSSDTVLFRAAWGDGDDRVEGEFVARVEPSDDDVPVFPSYDLGLQHRVMSLVAERTGVPVPAPCWFEDDPAVLGAPFFVMERFPGLVPPDVLPYTFPDDNWVVAASDRERVDLERSALETLAAIHRIEPATDDLGFLIDDDPEGSAEPDGVELLERHVAHWEGYKDWVTADGPSPLLDECFDRLWGELPEDLGPARLSWGDARIGNLLFTDFRVTGVLDWELAGVAPPAIDVGWMLYLHRFFQDITEDLGEAGLPDLFRPEAAAGIYLAAADWELGDLRWPMFYAAARHGVIMRRIGERMVDFGERDRPEDPEELIMHRATLRAMLDGTYWARVGL